MAQGVDGEHDARVPEPVTQGRHFHILSPVICLQSVKNSWLGQGMRKKKTC